MDGIDAKEKGLVDEIGGCMCNSALQIWWYYGF